MENLVYEVCGEGEDEIELGVERGIAGRGVDGRMSGGASVVISFFLSRGGVASASSSFSASSHVGCAIFSSDSCRVECFEKIVLSSAWGQWEVLSAEVEEKESESGGGREMGKHVGRGGWRVNRGPGTEEIRRRGGGVVVPGISLEIPAGLVWITRLLAGWAYRSERAEGEAEVLDMEEKGWRSVKEEEAPLAPQVLLLVPDEGVEVLESFLQWWCHEGALGDAASFWPSSSGVQGVGSGGGKGSSAGVVSTPTVCTTTTTTATAPFAWEKGGRMPASASHIFCCGRFRIQRLERKSAFAVESVIPRLQKMYPHTTPEVWKLRLHTQYTAMMSALSALLWFLIHVRANVWQVMESAGDENSMVVPEETARFLQCTRTELHPCQYQGVGSSKEGLSLFSILSQALQSAGGKRKLYHWFAFPTRDEAEVMERQAVVVFFQQPAHQELLRSLRFALHHMHPTSHLLHWVRAGKANTTHYARLYETFQQYTVVYDLLCSSPSAISLAFFRACLASFTIAPLRDVVTLLQQTFFPLKQWKRGKKQEKDKDGSSGVGANLPPWERRGGNQKRQRAKQRWKWKRRKQRSGSGGREEDMKLKYWKPAREEEEEQRDGLSSHSSTEQENDVEEEDRRVGHGYGKGRMHGPLSRSTSSFSSHVPMFQHGADPTGLLEELQTRLHEVPLTLQQKMQHLFARFPVTLQQAIRDHWWWSISSMSPHAPRRHTTMLDRFPPPPPWRTPYSNAWRGRGGSGRPTGAPHGVYRPLTAPSRKTTTEEAMTYSFLVEHLCHATALDSDPLHHHPTGEHAGNLEYSSGGGREGSFSSASSFRTGPWRFYVKIHGAPLHAWAEICYPAAKREGLPEMWGSRAPSALPYSHPFPPPPPTEVSLGFPPSPTCNVEPPFAEGDNRSVEDAHPRRAPYWLYWLPHACSSRSAPSTEATGGRADECHPPFEDEEEQERVREEAWTASTRPRREGAAPTSPGAVFWDYLEETCGLRYHHHEGEVSWDVTEEASMERLPPSHGTMVSDASFTSSTESTPAHRWENAYASEGAGFPLVRTADLCPPAHEDWTSASSSLLRCTTPSGGREEDEDSLPFPRGDGGAEKEHPAEGARRFPGEPHRGMNATPHPSDIPRAPPLPRPPAGQWEEVPGVPPATWSSSAVFYFTTPVLQEVEEWITTMQEGLQRREAAIRREVDRLLVLHSLYLLPPSDHLAALDCLLSFAVVAQRYGWVRPQILLTSSSSGEEKEEERRRRGSVSAGPTRHPAAPSPWPPMSSQTTSSTAVSFSLLPTTVPLTRSPAGHRVEDERSAPGGVSSYGDSCLVPTACDDASSGPRDEDEYRKEWKGAGVLHIIGGWHPILGCALGGRGGPSSMDLASMPGSSSGVPSTALLPFDFHIASPEDRICVVLGRNSSGKSVLLSAIALLVFLSHLGSFVPARAMSLTLMGGVWSASPIPTPHVSSFYSECVSLGRALAHCEGEKQALAYAVTQALVAAEEEPARTTAWEAMSRSPPEWEAQSEEEDPRCGGSCPLMRRRRPRQAVPWSVLQHWRPSVILLDEWGKGTQPQDGRALLGSVLRYLAGTNALAPSLPLDSSEPQEGWRVDLHGTRSLPTSVWEASPDGGGGSLSRIGFRCSTSTMPFSPALEALLTAAWRPIVLCATHFTEVLDFTRELQLHRFAPSAVFPFPVVQIYEMQSSAVFCRRRWRTRSRRASGEVEETKRHDGVPWRNKDKDKEEEEEEEVLLDVLPTYHPYPITATPASTPLLASSSLSSLATTPPPCGTGRHTNGVEESAAGGGERKVVASRKMPASMTGPPSLSMSREERYFYYMAHSGRWCGGPVLGRRCGLHPRLVEYWEETLQELMKPSCS